MGLIVDDNGHYRGWLASILCCFAALNEDEYPSERKKDSEKGKRSMTCIFTITNIPC